MSSLSNLFSSIKNASNIKKSCIIHKKSKQSIQILNLFIQEGIIKSYRIQKTSLEIFLKYNNQRCIFTNITMISTAGRRIYIKNKDLYKKKRGLYILSTSKGLLTDIQAKKKQIGGEILCIII